MQQLKANKIILITAAVLIVIGLIIVGISMPMYLSSNDFKGELQTRAITETISEINAYSDFGDVLIACDNTDTITVTYYENNKNVYQISTADNSLTIKPNVSSQDLKWYDQLINLNFAEKDKYDLIIKLPKTVFANCTVSTEYGDIESYDLTGGYLNFKTNCGDIELNNNNFINIACLTDYGDIDAEITTAENLDFETNCGDIKLNKVSGTQMTLDTDFGDIKGTISGIESDYSINAETNLGDKNIQNKSAGIKVLNAKSDLGDIYINFAN